MDQQVKEQIEKEINTNKVCLFMKGTPDAPQCGFSMAVSNILKILNVEFKGVNVLENQNLRDGIKTFSEWPTIPQLYINKETEILIGILLLTKNGKNTEKVIENI